MSDVLASIPMDGRIALIDLVRCPSHEARLAFPTFVADIARRQGGRVVWSGSIDQQLVGRGLDVFEDVVISEYPGGQACALAVAERRAWQPETFVSELNTWTARPWPVWRRRAAGVAAWWQRRLAGGPAPLRGDPPPGWIDGQGDGPVAPGADQLRALLADDRSRRVVLVDFHRYRPPSSGPTEGAARARGPTGRGPDALLDGLGGRIRHAAQSIRVIAGDPEASWDALSVVEYPSRAHLLGVLVDERYRAIAAHRTARLDRARRLVCTPHAAFHP